jgi:predicted O-methyltransferase YrrM
MYSSFHIAFKYLDYYLHSSNGKGHGVHSPFIFRFIEEILNDKTNYPEYDIIESIRKRLLADKDLIEVEDLGAGSLKSNSKTRSVSSIAKHSAKPKKYSQLLFRIARYFQPATIIELGTSLGITTSYLACANRSASVHTIEGARTVASIAERNFKQLDLNNIRLNVGNFDETLPALLKEITKPDLIFIDGNHQEKPTLNYFNLLLDRAHNDTIIVFDDIHWSKGMETAWGNIISHPRVTTTIDLFFIGIVFFRQEFHEKQHFVIRY